MAVQTNDVLEVACRCEFRGVEDVMNIFQWQYTGVAEAADADVADDLLTKMDDVYDGIISAQCTDFIYRDITIRNITQATVLGVFPWPVLTAGVAAVDNMPPGVGGLINMATNVARVVLRKYIGGLSSGVYEADGTLTSTIQAALVQFATDIITGLVVGVRTYVYGHLSPKTSAFELPVAATVTDIPAYQRRRKQGRGV